MGKGSVGTSTNIVCIKKEKAIPCDCERCGHSKRGAGTIYCSFYDIFSPNKKTCARYYCAKPAQKTKKKAKTKKSDTAKKKHQS